MTLDGKIAAYTGESKWITGEKAREHVHRQRDRYTAIMAGSGTVLADDPLLTCRIPGGRNPIRILCDSRLRIPLTANVIRTAGEVPTILATCCSEPERLLPYEKAGCRVLTIPKKDSHLDLLELMRRLGEEKIDSILLEGGGILNWSALECGIVNRIQAYIAPKVFGGAEAKTPVEGRGFPSPAEAVKLKSYTITPLGEDILIEGEVDADVHRNCGGAGNGAPDSERRPFGHSGD